MPDTDSSVSIPQQERLETLAERIRAACQAAQKAWSNALGHALDAGDALNEAQRHVLIGWKPWLEENHICVSTAQLYQQLARHRAELEAEMARVPGLGLRMGRKLIAKPKSQTPSINRVMKLGEGIVAKIKGTSLDSAKEMDELIVLDRGAPKGGHTPEVEQLVAAAAGGKPVSAINHTKSGAAFRRDHLCIGAGSGGEIARKDAEIEELRNAKRMLEIKIAGLESEIDEAKARSKTLDPRAWSKASSQERQRFLDTIGRPGILAAIPAKWDLRRQMLRAVPIAMLLAEFERRLPAKLWKKYQSALKAICHALDAPGQPPRLDLEVVPIADTAAMIDAIDMPSTGTGAKARVDIIAAASWIAKHAPSMAYVERAQAYPGQGASSGFSYGRAVGAIEAVVTMCSVPMTLVEASGWKRRLHLPGKDKEAARQRALQLFPSQHALLALKKWHGRAEAALIVVAGLKRAP
jgi:crossover junction endodeoxyribonuclease RuvC